MPRNLRTPLAALPRTGPLVVGTMSRSAVTAGAAAFGAVGVGVAGLATCLAGAGAALAVGGGAAGGAVVVVAGGPATACTVSGEDFTVANPTPAPARSTVMTADVARTTAREFM